MVISYLLNSSACSLYGKRLRGEMYNLDTFTGKPVIRLNPSAGVKKTDIAETHPIHCKTTLFIHFALLNVHCFFIFSTQQQKNLQLKRFVQSDIHSCTICH